MPLVGRTALIRTMSAAVLSGAFALVGVIVGGFVNGAVTRWQERRREFREARPAARLVMRELSEMQSILNANARREDAYRVGVPEPAAWPSQRAILASIVDGVTWTALENAYDLALYVAGNPEERGLPIRAVYSRGPL